MKHRDLLTRLRRAELRAGASKFMDQRRAWLNSGTPPLGRSARQVLDYEQLLAELQAVQAGPDDGRWPQNRERLAAAKIRLAAVAAARHGDESAWDTLRQLALARAAAS
jgi:hypothetical protein